MDDVQALRQLMESGFEALKDRLEDDRRLSAQRHSENVGRLESIEREVRYTNGRVTRQEEQTKSIWRALPRRHEDAPRKQGDSEPKEMSRVDFKYLVIAFGAGASAIVWLLHLAGKL